MDKPIVLLAGHSFVKHERLNQVDFNHLPFYSEGFPKPGLCYRDLEPKGPSYSGSSLIDELRARCQCHRRPRPSVLALVLGDNDFSNYDRVTHRCSPHESVHEVIAHPHVTAQSWIDSAVYLANNLNIPNLVMCPVLPRFFLCEDPGPGNVERLPARRQNQDKPGEGARRHNRLLKNQMKFDKWSLDSSNYHALAGRQVNNALSQKLSKNIWRSRGGVSIAFLGFEPFKTLMPSNFEECNKNFIERHGYRDCVHPSPETFRDLYLNNLQKVINKL